MSDSEVGAIVGTYFLIIAIIMIATIVFSIIIYWKIFSKAGFSGALSLLMFVPVANIIMLCVLAFSEWPIHRELNMLRHQAMSRGGFPPGPGYSNPNYPPQYPQY